MKIGYPENRSGHHPGKAHGRTSRFALAVAVILSSASASAALPIDKLQRANRVLADCRIVSMVSGDLRYMDVAGVSQEGGAKVNIWPRNTILTNQTFTLMYVGQVAGADYGRYMIVPEHSGKCIYHQSGLDGASVEQWSCSAQAEVDLQLIPGTTAVYAIRTPQNSNSVWNVENSGTAPGTLVKIRGWANVAAQKWLITGCKNMKNNGVRPEG